MPDPQSRRPKQRYPSHNIVPEWWINLVRREAVLDALDRAVDVHRSNLHPFSPNVDRERRAEKKDRDSPIAKRPSLGLPRRRRRPRERDRRICAPPPRLCLAFPRFAACPIMPAGFAGFVGVALFGKEVATFPASLWPAAPVSKSRILADAPARFRGGGRKKKCYVP